MSSARVHGVFALLFLIQLQHAVAQQAVGRALTFEGSLPGALADNLKPNCTRHPSILYDKAKAQGSMQVVRGNSSFLPPWAPGKNKYMVLNCYHGLRSNHKLCLRNSMIVAGLLNRTLVAVNNSIVNWGWMLDVEGVRACFGRNTIVTLHELQQQLNLRTEGNNSWNEVLGPLGIQPIVSAPRATFEQAVQQYKAWSNATVLDLGDLAPTNVFHRYKEFGDIPFRRVQGCKSALAIAPNPAIVSLARRFLDINIKGKRFLAVHWRQGKDFMNKFCGGNPDGPITVTMCLREWTMMKCMAAKAKAARVTTIVVFSDGPFPTLIRLRKDLEESGFNVTVNPSILHERIVKLNGWEVEAETEFTKFVMAAADVFLGSEASTYTADVMRIRTGLGKETCNDAIICEGYPFKVQEMRQPERKWFTNML